MTSKIETFIHLVSYIIWTHRCRKEERSKKKIVYIIWTFTHSQIYFFLCYVRKLILYWTFERNGWWHFGWMLKVTLFKNRKWFYYFTRVSIPLRRWIKKKMECLLSLSRWWRKCLFSRNSPYFAALSNIFGSVSVVISAITC